MLRLSLIIAIAAGLGAATVSHLKVAQKIATLINERDMNAQERDMARSAETTARRDASEAKANLERTNRDLNAATNNLAVKSAEADQQRKRADRSSADLENTTRERNEAQRELAAWRATGLMPGQVQEVVDRLKKTGDERDAIAAESDILLRNNRKLQAKVMLYEEPRYIVPLPPGLTGNVVAVDPKWDFVVLDIGSADRVLEGGELLVNRDGKLIAKVRVTSVEPNRSIANIIPEWKQEDVMEGDQVLY